MVPHVRVWAALRTVRESSCSWMITSSCPCSLASAVRDTLQDVTGTVRVVCRIRGRLPSDRGLLGTAGSGGGGSSSARALAAKIGVDIGDVFALLGSNEDDSKQGEGRWGSILRLMLASWQFALSSCTALCEAIHGHCRVGFVHPGVVLLPPRYSHALPTSSTTGQGDWSKGVSGIGSESTMVPDDHRLTAGSDAGLPFASAASTLVRRCHG
jgi:hypothetical protein